MKKIIIGIAFIILLLGCLKVYFDENVIEPGFNENLAYSDFIHKVNSSQVAQVELNGRNISLRTKSGEELETYNPGDPNLVSDLLNAEVKIKTIAPKQQSLLMQIFISWFPMLVLIAICFYFMSRLQNKGIGSKEYQKHKAKLFSEDQVTVSFNDVAGCEEAKEEVAELVDFLKAPHKFHKLGGKIPRGILMVGPPGTGKTLIARAIAGEAGVKFYSISGSDFVEMYVGVGASRVRELFGEAKKHSPCIVFIDEIDAVGKKRSQSGIGNSNEEREQTLNQLLVEMDGFEDNQGIIVIAATNRVDVLDDALLRPGRFDRQVNVGLPDLSGREEIINVHLQNIPTETNVDSSIIARGTPGFSGAELANLVNEAALYAARKDLEVVTMNCFEKAKDKIMMGAEKHSLIMSEDDKKLTAYHEAGHCIVGQLMPDHDPVYKVSIMPRGRAMGITMFLPETDQYSASKRKLESQIAGLLGGRIAERIIYGNDRVTTGASNDIERATDLARKMVTRWGLSDKLGPLVYGEQSSAASTDFPSQSNMSNNVAMLIDEEIRDVIDKNYSKAEKILEQNLNILHEMAKALMKWETIDQFQINELMKGKIEFNPQE